MGKRETTSAAIDSLLKVAVGGGVLSVALLAPNAIRMLDKPLRAFFDGMDARERERRLKKLTSYMKSRGLLAENYQHGLVVTRAGKRRAERADYTNLAITLPAKWDEQWRLVMFDIPEQHHKTRKELTAKLRMLGFQPLQQSIWIHPFPCRDVLQTITIRLNVSKYVTYIETAHIDHSDKLRTRFKSTLSNI